MRPPRRLGGGTRKLRPEKCGGRVRAGAWVEEKQEGERRREGGTQEVDESIFNSISPSFALSLSFSSDPYS